jgi:putative DNA primase/helicase
VALDFAGIAAAALAQGERLCSAWLGGRRVGHEWVGERTVNGGPGDSWSVNLNSGQWGHYGGDERGGDLISLYAALNHTDQGAAARAVGELVGLTNGAGGAPLVKPHTEPQETPVDFAPADAPLPGPHPRHGAPSAMYRYLDAVSRLAFVVARYDLSTGKQFAQYTWRGGKWWAKAHPQPRPLYGLPQLAANPTIPVLIVEGEKCRDAAAAALPDYVCITWAGGAQAAKTADWTALEGRDVTIWPDSDKPGVEAAAVIAGVLLKSARSLRAINVSGQPEGWDISDAIVQGWDRSAITTFMNQRAKVLNTPTPELKVGRKHDAEPPVEQSGASSVITWQSLGLACNSGGIPFPSIANAAIILAQHPIFAGHIWHDDFSRKIMCNLDGVEAKPWTDANDLQVTAYIQNQLAISKLGLQTVVHAVQLVAYNARRNSVTDYLGALSWDGTERLSMWLSDHLGAPNTAYTQAVARNWVISMVARAYKPGCQADHMPVLEGSSGRGKSSALAILGGPWYRAAPQAFGSKEFLEVIQGAWLIEIPDMVGFGRREHTQIISAITTRTDAYRASYGRHAEEHPRTTIFAATSETDDYLQDSRGIRRYWPIRCTEINLEALAYNRDQLFAEAVHAFKAGATWHEMPVDETRDEQLARQEADIWLETIASFVENRSEVVASEVARYALDIDTPKLDRAVQMRVAKCLKMLGFECDVGKSRSRKSVRIYRRGAR